MELNLSRPPSNARERNEMNIFIQRRERQVVHLRRQVQESEARIRTFEAELARARDSLAPIRRLDAYQDVLRMIFDRCIEVDAMAPWRLAGVTGSWRRVLHDSPTRWSRIVLPSSLFSQAVGRRVIPSFVHAWLALTGHTVPLEVELDSRQTEWPRDLNEPALQVAIAILLEQIQRFRSFSYFPPTGFYIDFTVLVHVNSAPLLESLCLKGESWNIPRTMLQTLRYLTCIPTGKRPVRDILAVLARCGNLRCLSLRLAPDGRQVINSEPTTTVTLPKLRELEVVAWHPSKTIISALRTPNLDSLAFINDRTPDCPNTLENAWTFDGLFKQRPVPSIKRLSFDNVLISLDSAVARLPYVQSIHVSQRYGRFRRPQRPEHLSWLHYPLRTRDRQGAWPMPLLREIVVETNGFDDRQGEESIYERFRERIEASADPDSALRLTIMELKEPDDDFQFTSPF